MAELGELLKRVNAGEAEARQALFAAAYGELRKLARSRLYAGGRPASMSTTTLVHESYMRFAGSGALRAEDRRAFFAYASQVMRSVIVDTARARQAERRGGDAELVTLDTGVVDSTPAGEDEIVRIHDALLVLAEAEPRLAQVVEMRFFGGYTEQEIADHLEVTERTVRRDWDKARLLLRAALAP